MTEAVIGNIRKGLRSDRPVVLENTHSGKVTAQIVGKLVVLTESKDEGSQRATRNFPIPGQGLAISAGTSPSGRPILIIG